MSDRGKVYVIDDDEAMRDSLDFLLGSADFHVTLFESAHHFLDAVSSIDFGCVVSDVRMPGIDGIELLKRMKASHSAFPVVIMTGHGDVPLAVEAMKLGAVDFLEKPFEDERLIGMIDAALRQAESSARSEAALLARGHQRGRARRLLQPVSKDFRRVSRILPAKRNRADAG